MKLSQTKVLWLFASLPFLLSCSQSFPLIVQCQRPLVNCDCISAHSSGKPSSDKVSCGSKWQGEAECTSDQRRYAPNSGPNEFIWTHKKKNTHLCCWWLCIICFCHLIKTAETNWRKIKLLFSLSRESSLSNATTCCDTSSDCAGQVQLLLLTVSLSNLFSNSNLVFKRAHIITLKRQVWNVSQEMTYSDTERELPIFSK